MPSASFNRQLGRNAEHYARALAALETPEARYPHLRTLVGVIEQSRPEWITVGRKDQLFAELIGELGADVPAEEVARAIAARDLEFTLAAEAAKTPRDATREERAQTDGDRAKTAARTGDGKGENPAEPKTPINQADAEASGGEGEQTPGAGSGRADSSEEE
jgi:hypothetical protein